jgi:peroxiredoxin
MWFAAFAAAATATCICLVAFPTPRALAHYCLDCSVLLWQSISPASHLPANVTPGKNRKVAPAFVLDDASGKPVRLSDFKGEVVLLNFWATWCGGCQIEIPWFIEFDQNYKDRGFVVIGVSMDDDSWTSVRPYLKEKKVNYPIVIGNDDLRKRYGLSSMPMTLIIDRSGHIASTHVGLVSKNRYKSEIEALLNEQSAAVGSVQTRQ